MLQECVTVIQESFKRPFKQVLRGVSRGFQGSFIEDLRKFEEIFKVFNRSLKLLEGRFKVVLFFKVYCCMSLIAATRAETRLGLQCQTPFFPLTITKILGLV